MAKHNIDAYIERRMQQVLERSIAALIDQKFKKVVVDRMVHTSGLRYQRQSMNELAGVLRGGYESYGQSVLGSFGTSQNQFMNMFAVEMRSAFLRAPMA